MTVLVLGLVVFLGVHLVPVFPGLRARLAARWGERRYKGRFSAASGVGLALIVVGYALAPSTPAYAPWPPAFAIAPVAIPVAIMLVAAGNLRGHIAATLGHPMLIGTILWAFVHLAANGEAKAALLFGGFLAWALVDLASAVRRGAVRRFVPTWKHDVIAIAGGLAVAVAIAWLHRPLFGVRVVPWGL